MAVLSEPTEVVHRPVYDSDLLILTTGLPNGEETYHIGVCDSQGCVVEFGPYGMRMISLNNSELTVGSSSDRIDQLSQLLLNQYNNEDGPRPDWRLARPVRFFAKLCAKGSLLPSQATHFAGWWDHTLYLMLTAEQIMDSFRADRYDSVTRNCLSFVMAFLKSLCIEALDPWLHSRALFTQTFLADQLPSMQPSSSSSNQINMCHSTSVKDLR